MVKLSSDQQELFMHLGPEGFVPAKGVWGRRGATSVRLSTAPKALVSKALAAAWRNTAPRTFLGRYDLSSVNSSKAKK